jgi:uncharacterized OB-fold protein
VTELLVQVCDRCSHAVFPVRVLCPRCGSRDWHEIAAAGGVAEQVTTHRAGGRIASVATDAGPVVIARAGEGVERGSRVALEFDGGAPVADVTSSTDRR